MNIQPFELNKDGAVKSLTPVFAVSPKGLDHFPQDVKADVKETMPFEKSDDTSRQSSLAEYLTTEIQKNIDRLGINLEFSTFGRNNEKIAIVVKEKATGTIIREIPQKDIQRLYEKMDEMTGILINKDA